MKIIKLNSFSTFLISMLVIGFVILLPIVLIQVAWNETIGNVYDYLTINFWQAFILWLIVLTILNIAGLFKFKIIFDTKDQDEDTIRNSIESLTANTEEKAKDLDHKD